MARTQTQKANRLAARRRNAGKNPQQVARGGQAKAMTQQQQAMDRISREAGLATSQEKQLAAMLTGRVRPTFTAPKLGLARTMDGEEWALARLHPCVEPAPVPRGIPDRSAATVVAPFLRGTTNVSKLTSIDNPVYDLEIVFLPIPEVDFIFRQRASSSSVWGSWNVQLFPGFSRNANGSSTTLETLGYAKYRTQGRAHTMHLRASATTNQGTVFGGQVEGVEFINNYTAGVDSTGGTTSGSTQVQFQLPNDSSELIGTDPAAVQWEAFNGGYMVMRSNVNSQPYLDCGGDAAIAYDGVGDTPTPGFLPETWFQIKANVPGLDNFDLTPAPTFTLPSGAPSLSIQKYMYGISTPDAFLTGVVFFEGLDQAASVQVKSHLFLENELDAGTGSSALRPFAKTSPLYDMTALERVAVVEQASPHMYPASFNDFSTVMKSIWGVLKKVGLPIADVLAGAGIPLVSPAIGIGAKLARGLF